MIEEFLKLFRLMPFVLVSYFLISGIFNSNFKAFLVFTGIVITMVVTTIMGKMLQSFLYAEATPDKVLESIKTYSIFNIASTPFSVVPLSINIYAFLLSYYSFVLFAYDTKKNKKMNKKTMDKQGSQNWFLMVFLILIVILDILYLSVNFKEMGPIGLSAILGAVFGVIWALIIGRRNWAIPSANVVEKCGPSDMKYSCTLNTSGNLIKNA
jgi:putative Ca2+/H+ antiporter (TMEM165/GDT1 family)